MEPEITLESISKRLAELEIAVTALTQHGTKPSGKFAHLGGGERRPTREVEKTDKPIDFSSIGGKRVG